MEGSEEDIRPKSTKQGPCEVRTSRVDPMLNQSVELNSTQTVQSRNGCKS